MNVYIEYVLIENFIIDYFMIKATLCVVRLTAKKGRLLFCALLGSVFSVVFPLLILPTVLLTLIKILLGMLLTLIATDYKTIKSYVVTTVIFFACTFFCGGAIYGVMEIFNIPLESEVFISLITIPVYIVLRVFSEIINYFYLQKTINQFSYKVELSLMGNSISCTGLLDTGNGLTYDGAPVIVCSKKLALNLIGDNLARIKFIKIAVNTVQGNSENTAFKIDMLKIFNMDKMNIHNNVTLMIANNSFNGYDVILNPLFIGGINNEQTFTKTKKIS